MSAKESNDSDDLFLDTLGISDEEREQLRAELQRPGAVDAVVRYMIAATNGIMYSKVRDKLDSYPIPDLRLPAGNGTFLDIGCNWGRWCIAAARKGYQVVGIDPSLGAVLAAQRVSQQLGCSCKYVVADARFLPFADASFDVVFSYSVIQHLSKPDAAVSLQEMARTLRPAGSSLVQMPNALGIRSLFHQARRRFQEPQGFEVRYWAPGELLRVFNDLIGPTRLSVDGFFGLGIQKTDACLMPWKYRAVIACSEMLRAISKVVAPLRRLADSVYLRSSKRAHA
jgi:2-polyprenyl-3-methyl-5-hydroxy-6-metoxy-1,4-benzoquinol methylase